MNTSRLVIAIAAAAVATTSAVGNGNAAGTEYVALGDSYTAAPGLLDPVPGSPPLCTRSLLDYPHDVAAALGLALTDVSCASAATSNTTTAQYVGQPPQFNALTATTQIVTYQLGGNDNNTFETMVVGCLALDAADAINAGTPCKDAFGSKFSAAITADAPNIGATIAQIHIRSPQAKVFVVGYPDILPQTGGCYPQVPLTDGDITYANGVETQLNTVLQQQAQANNATYVNIYTPSIGHDACRPESVRWVEPPVVGRLNATPIHPNAAGQAATAKTVEAAI